MLYMVNEYKLKPIKIDTELKELRRKNYLEFLKVHHRKFKIQNGLYKEEANDKESN